MLLELSQKHADVLQRMKDVGVCFDHFFDIGAARGDWGTVVKKQYPDADLHFFEAAPVWEAGLIKIAADLPGNNSVNMMAVGDSIGTTNFRFDPKNVYGGAIVNQPGENTIEVKKSTLDQIIQDRPLEGRFALKLDTHGAEQMILNGATEFMKRCDFVIFETYNFGPATRRLGQMLVLFEERFGLDLIDMAEPLWRPKDNALWQLDCYLVRWETLKGKTKLEDWPF